MEISSGDLYSHVFIGPEVRSGISFAGNPVRVGIKSDVVLSRSISAVLDKYKRPQAMITTSRFSLPCLLLAMSSSVRYIVLRTLVQQLCFGLVTVCYCSCVLTVPNAPIMFVFMVSR